VSDEAPKSAVELAMERLRKKDKEAGESEAPLSEAQRSAILEVKRIYEAKLAEQEILHKSALQSVGDVEALAALEEGYRAERARLVSERESKLEAARKKP
jgi:hypothetical protein